MWEIGNGVCGKAGMDNGWRPCSGIVIQYRRRLADSTIEDLLREVPTLLLVGPRASGKTTTAARFAKTLIRLDRESEASAFRADPDVALAGLAEPILLDEWQVVPNVLGAVKRAVDVGTRPGRFLLTGSVRADLEADTWPGTGRVVRLPLAPFTVAERVQSGTRPLLDRLVAHEQLEPARDNVDLRGYVRLALASGFPEAAFQASDRARRRWLESYVEQLLTRDAESLDQGRDPVRLRRYFEAYALNTAGIVEDKTLYDAAGITRKTAISYERLLSNLLVVDKLPAWTSNRLKRLTLAPKRHVVDAGLVAGVLGVDDDAVLREGDLFGHVLESFVVAQVRAEAAFTDCRPRLYRATTSARSKGDRKSTSSPRSARET